ncbi:MULTISPECIES: hypothetical protein [unclassified Streptomyces]|nr:MULTISPECIES: hypothetical protein [unclassified Streptomyces]
MPAPHGPARIASTDSAAKQRWTPSPAKPSCTPWNRTLVVLSVAPSAR